jgi:pimeloyl-ACP methyl ester carboxylesterase
MTKHSTGDIVLVPGACCGAWIWADVVDLLERRGVGAWAVDLPSVGGPPSAPADLHADADAVRQVLDRATAPVVVCGHSYGGMVITEAAAGHPSVTHLAYLAAVVPDIGESLLELASGNDPTALAGVFTTLYEPQGEDWLGAGSRGLDLVLGPGPKALIEAAAALFAPQSAAVMAQPVTGAAWREIPSTYLWCRHDRLLETALGPAFRRSAQRASAIVPLPCGHSPQVTWPELVADVLVDLARSPLCARG